MIVLDALIDKDHGGLQVIDDIEACRPQNRAGCRFSSGSAIVDEDVIKRSTSLRLRPLHNPAHPAYQGCRAVLPSVPQVRTFDTAFHQTMGTPTPAGGVQLADELELAPELRWSFGYPGAIIFMILPGLRRHFTKRKNWLYDLCRIAQRVFDPTRRSDKRGALRRLSTRDVPSLAIASITKIASATQINAKVTILSAPALHRRTSPPAGTSA